MSLYVSDALDSHTNILLFETLHGFYAYFWQVLVNLDLLRNIIINLFVVETEYSPLCIIHFKAHFTHDILYFVLFYCYVKETSSGIYAFCNPYVK